MKCIIIISALVASLALYASAADPCTTTEQCKCTQSDGFVVDLTKFQKKTIVDEKGSWQYEYDPCTPFTDGDCKDVVACQLNKDLQEYHPIATLKDGKFVSTTDGLAVVYTGANSTLTVNLKCDQMVDDEDLSVDSSSAETTSNHVFTLKSKTLCAMPNTTSTAQTSTTTPKAPTNTTKAQTTKTTTPAPKTNSTAATTTPATKTSTKPTPATNSTKTTSKTTTPGKSTSSSKPGSSTPKATTTVKSTAKSTASSKPQSSTGPTHKTTTHHGGASALSSLAFGTLLVLAFLSRKLQ